MFVCLLLLSTPAQAADGVAGFGPKGFTVADASGDNTLNFGLSFQPRVTATLDGDPSASDADTLSDVGVRIRRMLFTANGTLAGRIDYRFRVNAANTVTFTDGDGKAQLAARPLLDDAQLVFRIADPFQLAVGQWKVPFTLSQAMSDTTLLFPDRPLPIDGYKYGQVKVDGHGWSRDAGAAVLGTVAEKRFEYAVGVFNGDGQNVWPGDEGQLFAGRVQLAPLGEFKYDEVDLQHGKPRFAVGASGSFNTHPSFADDGNAGDPTTILRAGADTRFAVTGLSVQAEVLYGLGTDPAADSPTRSLGAYAQVGYVFAPTGVAPGFRWSRSDPSLDTDADTVTQLEGVVNWYLPNPAQAGENLGHKAQVQLAWTTSLLEGTDHPIAHQIQLATAVGF